MKYLTKLALMVFVVMAFGHHTITAQQSDLSETVKIALQAYKNDVDLDRVLITNVETEQGWSRGHIVITVPDDIHGAPDSYIFLAQTDSSGNQQVAIQYTSKFADYLLNAPVELVSLVEKTVLQPPAESRSKANDSAQLSLPWATGESWVFTSGPHDYDGNGVDINGKKSNWGSLDFADDSGSGDVRAARDGIAYVPCANTIQIEHGDGWATKYYHVRDIAVTDGKPVLRGTYLGKTSAETKCEGLAYGPHVHFTVMENGTEVEINGYHIGGWTIWTDAALREGCMVKIGQTNCLAPGNNYIYNDGTVGSGNRPIVQPSCPSPNTTFCDVPDGSSRYGAIEEVQQAGLMNGYQIDGDRFFGMSDPALRQHISVIIARWLYKYNSNYQSVLPPPTGVFPDMQEFNEFTLATEMLYRDGIVGGGSNGLFDPLDEVTRSEFILMVMRTLLAHEDVGSTDCRFEDTDDELIEKACDLGIISKSPNFKPDGTISRELVALVVCRAFIDSASCGLEHNDRLSELRQIRDNARDAQNRSRSSYLCFTGSSRAENAGEMGSIGDISDGELVSYNRDRKDYFDVCDNPNPPAPPVRPAPPDTTTPNTTISNLPPPTGSNGWHTSDVSLHISATDSTTRAKNSPSINVARIHYKINSGSWTSQNGSSVTIPVTTNGVNTVYYKAEDTAGNIETPKSVQINLDKTNPSASHTTPSGASNGWYKANVNVPISCSDTDSQVATCQYSIGSGSWTNISGGSVPVTTDGITTISYRAADNAGRISSIGSVSIKLDKTNPSASHTALSGGSNGWYNTNLNVALACSDGHSGVSNCQYRLNAGNWTNATGNNAPVTTNGITTVSYRAIDNAGNISAVGSVEVKLDKTAPTTSNATLPAGGTNGWYTANSVNVSLAGTDDHSGLAHCQYHNGDSNWVTLNGCTGTVPVMTEGTTTVSYRTTDNAGNVSAAKSIKVSIDRSAPTISTMSLNNGGSESYARTLVVGNSAADAFSGLFQMCATFNNTDWECHTYDKKMLFAVPAKNKTTQIVSFKVIDAAGHESAVLSDTILLNFYPAAPSSSSYKLCSSTFASVAGTTSSSQYTLISSAGNIGGNNATSTGYSLQSGFLSQDQCSPPLSGPPLAVEASQIKANHMMVWWLMGSVMLILTAVSYIAWRRHTFH